MSTVAMVATQIPNSKVYYNIKNQNPILYHPGEYIACKIWQDGYPYLESYRVGDGYKKYNYTGVLSHLDINHNGYDYVVPGNRRQIHEFDSYLETQNIDDIPPRIFKDRLSLDHWLKENWDVEYFYFLLDGYYDRENRYHFNKRWMWKKVNHFDEHNQIDYSLPDEQWQDIVFKDGEVLI